MSYIGFSKRVAPGLYLRFGKNINTRPTKKAQKEHDDTLFLQDYEEKIKQAVANFLVYCNIANLKKGDTLPDLLKPDDKEKFISISNLIEQFDLIVDDIHRGKSFTQTRKDTLIDILRDIETIVNYLPKSELAQLLEKKETEGKVFRFINITFIFLIIVTLSSDSSDLVIFPVIGLLISIIFQIKSFFKREKEINNLYPQHYS